MGQHHPWGWGFFLSVTATRRAVRFFQPMDARWCCSNTVFQALAVVIVESRFIFIVSQSINKLCGLQWAHDSNNLVYVFGSFVFEHGWNMPREFRRETRSIMVVHQLTTVNSIEDSRYFFVKDKDKGWPMLLNEMADNWIRQIFDHYCESSSSPAGLYMFQLFWCNKLFD